VNIDISLSGWALLKHISSCYNTCIISFCKRQANILIAFGLVWSCHFLYSLESHLDKDGDDKEYWRSDKPRKASLVHDRRRKESRGDW
jgi:hypothetical protein